MTGSPEFAPTVNKLLTPLINPSGLLNVAKASCPSGRVRPLENAPVIMPSVPTPKLVSDLVQAIVSSFLVFTGGVEMQCRPEDSIKQNVAGASV